MMARNDEFSVRRLWIGHQQIRVRCVTRAFDAFHHNNNNSVPQQRVLDNTDIVAVPANPDQDNFDGTGLLLWPGSRVLIDFLANPCGARRYCPRLVAEEFDDNSCCPASSGEICLGTADPRRCSEENTINRGNDCLLARRHRSATVLELGAGTGICGIAASMIFGCSVILTDRRDDVVRNLQKNVSLNALEHKAQVRRLAWGETAQGMSCEIRNQAPFKVIIASDTVYPGKPLSDTEAFFAMAADLLVRSSAPTAELIDPVEGVLLLAYTPRPPSLITENMLRCAYRLGLRGTRLDGEWSCVGSTSSSGAAVDGIGCRHDGTRDDARSCPGWNRASCRESELLSSGHHLGMLTEDGTGNNNISRDQAAGHHSGCGSSRHGNNESNKSVGACGEQSLAGPPTTGGRRCRPVLVTFRLASAAVQSAVFESGVGDRSPCAPEWQWYSEWQQMFPGLNHKVLTTANRPATCLVEGVGGHRPQGVALAESAEISDLDLVCTSEELWGA